MELYILPPTTLCVLALLRMKGEWSKRHPPSSRYDNAIPEETPPCLNLIQITQTQKKERGAGGERERKRAVETILSISVAQCSAFTLYARVGLQWPPSPDTRGPWGDADRPCSGSS